MKLLPLHHFHEFLFLLHTFIPENKINNFYRSSFTREQLNIDKKKKTQPLSTVITSKLTSKYTFDYSPVR